MMSEKLVEPMEMRSGARFVLAATDKEEETGGWPWRGDVLVSATAG